MLILHESKLSILRHSSVTLMQDQATLIESYTHFHCCAQAGTKSGHHHQLDTFTVVTRSLSDVVVKRTSKEQVGEYNHSQF